ncbi:MAG: YcfL family protein [Methylococcales bacterium]|nr:YcfL family protein [Methylococcales bacterium]MDD5753389.1 YcfL family protein [Methylococcales bacterium]
MKPINTFKMLSIVTALTLSACATEPLPPPAPNSIPAKVEQFGEMSYLQVSNIITTKRNHLMAIQAEIFNTDSTNQQLYYRFKWLDKSGMVIGDDEAWQPLLVYAGQKQTINALAPSPQATDFRILVSSPDNTGNP